MIIRALGRFRLHKCPVDKLIGDETIDSYWLCLVIYAYTRGNKHKTWNSPLWEGRKIIFQNSLFCLVSNGSHVIFSEGIYDNISPSPFQKDQVTKVLGKTQNLHVDGKPKGNSGTCHHSRGICDRHDGFFFRVWRTWRHEGICQLPSIFKLSFWFVMSRGASKKQNPVLHGPNCLNCLVFDSPSCGSNVFLAPPKSLES